MSSLTTEGVRELLEDHDQRTSVVSHLMHLAGELACDLLEARDERSRIVACLHERLMQERSNWCAEGARALEEALDAIEAQP